MYLKTFFIYYIIIIRKMKNFAKISFSTVIGVMAGGVHVVAYFLFNLFILVALPAVLYFAFRMLQYAYDYVVHELLIKRVFNRK